MCEQELPAPCGLDCAVCDIYKAAQDSVFAKQLAESWKSWNPEAKPEWFRCQGCHGDRQVRWCDDCHIATCCETRSLQDCSACNVFPCQSYLDWVGPYAHHQAALERLKNKAGQQSASAR